MNKVLFFVMAATLFYGCKKEHNGTPDPMCPVTEVVLPASSAENPVQSGKPVTIQGYGFTEHSEIWLRAATKTADIRATVTHVSASSITFTTPPIYGEQDIILKQNSEEWNLGKMYFTETPIDPEEDDEIKILPKKIVRSIVTYTDNTDPYVAVFNYVYDNRNKLEHIKLRFNDNTEEDAIEIVYSQQTLTISDFTDYYNRQYVFGLADGRATNCIFEEKLEGGERREMEFSYSDDGYLHLCNETEYTGILTLDDKGALTRYSQQDPYESYSVAFEPDLSAPNNLNLDLMGNDEFAACIHENIHMLYLSGSGGKRIKYLPKRYVWKYDDENENTWTVTYDYEFEDEYLTVIRITSSNGWNKSIVLEYEE